MNQFLKTIFLLSFAISLTGAKCTSSKNEGNAQNRSASTSPSSSSQTDNGGPGESGHTGNGSRGPGSEASPTALDSFLKAFYSNDQEGMLAVHRASPDWTDSLHELYTSFENAEGVDFNPYERLGQFRKFLLAQDDPSFEEAYYRIEIEREPDDADGIARELMRAWGIWDVLLKGRMNVVAFLRNNFKDYLPSYYYNITPEEFAEKVAEAHETLHLSGSQEAYDKAQGQYFDELVADDDALAIEAYEYVQQLSDDKLGWEVLTVGITSDDEESRYSLLDQAIDEKKWRMVEFFIVSYPVSMREERRIKEFFTTEELSSEALRREFLAEDGAVRTQYPLIVKYLEKAFPVLSFDSDDEEHGESDDDDGL